MYTSVKDNDFNINPIRVIMAGGDGTIMWGMMELGNHDIDPRDIVVGCLPLGTGNDWSRAMGWGGFFDTSFTNKDLKVLKLWVIDILMADLYNFDLWAVNISLKDDGHFSQIKDGVSHVLKVKNYLYVCVLCVYIYIYIRTFFFYACMYMILH
jgi:diacylglycerol kinase (ATP)